MRLQLVVLAAILQMLVVTYAAGFIDASLAQSSGLFVAIAKQGAWLSGIYGVLLGAMVYVMGLLPLVGAAFAAALLALLGRAAERSTAPGLMFCFLLIALATFGGWLAGLQLSPSHHSEYDSRGTTYAVLCGLTFLLYVGACSLLVWGALAPGRWRRLIPAPVPPPPPRQSSR